MVHPNVLPGLALGEADGQPFMVMALLSSTLRREMPRDPAAVPFWVRWRDVKKWPMSRSMRYAVELARALRYCHHEVCER